MLGERIAGKAGQIVNTGDRPASPRWYNLKVAGKAAGIGACERKAIEGQRWRKEDAGHLFTLA